MKSILYDTIKKHRKENPITSKTMELMFKCSGAKVRELVRRLRREGFPIGILSDSDNNSGGYYLCQSKQEIEETIENLEGRAKSLFETISKLRQTAIRLDIGQGRLF